MKNKTNGITLVALVITIIVLLILAGITISLTLGEGGIIKHAQTAGEEYEKASLKEELELAIFDIKKVGDIKKYQLMECIKRQESWDLTMMN